MIDAFHFSPLPNEIWIPGNLGVATEGQLTIPKNANMLWFTCVQGGSGGGMATVGAASAGGTGGSSGYVAHLMIAASVVPKTLYFYIGSAGVGATVPGLGAAANPLYLACSRINIAAPIDEDTLMVAGAVSVNEYDLARLGVWLSNTQQAGGAGTTTNGTAIAVATSLFISAGAGGGGSSGGTGGNQTSASALYPTIAGGATGDNPGGNGIMLPRPLICIGGAGGGGINGAGTGANRGGNGGGYGSGGGGGGNAASGVSGNGGNGAPGLLIMRWW